MDDIAFEGHRPLGSRTRLPVDSAWRSDSKVDERLEFIDCVWNNFILLVSERDCDAVGRRGDVKVTIVATV
jgi:hypothetical protein